MNGIIDAPADHPPSKHTCNRMPIAAPLDNDLMSVFCADCGMIWYTNATIKASEYAIFHEAETRYGGKPESVIKSATYHPLIDLYLVDEGKRRCFTCTRVLPISEFMYKPGVDKNHHKCITCRHAAQNGVSFTAEESRRIVQKSRAARPMDWKGRPMVMSKRKIG